MSATRRIREWQQGVRRLAESPAVRTWSRRCLGLRAGALFGGSLIVAGALRLGACFVPDFWRGPLGRAHALLAGWTAVALTLHLLALRRAARRGDARGENLRWMFLGLSGFFLLGGLMTATPHGGGDAVWYGTMLADMIAQVRAGVFPVWVGQSLWQFNGAVYPLRVAPGFHYLGALADALSFHSLGVFAVQNLLLVLLGFAGLFSAYFSLGALMPGRRWLAAGLAALYLACPGVLGIAYNSDLFMSWTTLPWVPLAWFATVRSFQDGGARRTLLLLGGSLGACWWGHSPIALWMTLFAAGAQVLRICVRPPDRRGWLNAALAAAAFLAVAAYPVGSVLLFPPDPSAKAYAFQAASPAGIVYFVRQAFPGCLLPVSPMASVLSDLQLGYGLWAVLLFAAWRCRRSPAAGCLVAFSIFVLALLIPLPGMNLELWKLTPGLVRNTTGNWAMNRLYLVSAGAIVFACAAAAPPVGKGRRRVLGAAIALGCLWSGREATKFLAGSRAAARLPASAVDLLRPENVTITRFSYFVFPRPPAYFTHGAVDPALENRLWLPGAAEPFAADLSAARSMGSEAGKAAFGPPSLPVNYLVTPALRLEAGRSYVLQVDFDDPARARGIVQLIGTSLFREYQLPEYGESRSFGVGGRHTNLIALRTSQAAGETFFLRFVPDGSLGPAQKLLPLGEATLFAYDPGRLPVRVLSWIPYRAAVVSPKAAWLETPRMYQAGYTARVDGRPAAVRKSTEGLVEVEVPPGRSKVEVDYRAPAGLQVLFWISAIAIGGLVAAALGALWSGIDARGRRRLSGRSCESGFSPPSSPP